MAVSSSNKEINILIERLSLQVRSFQEGFELLSQASSLEFIAKQFGHILRGSLLTTEVNFFYKDLPEKKWKSLTNSKSEKQNLLETNSQALSYTVEIIEEGKPFIRCILPLVDNSIIGIIIGQKLDKSPFSNFDLVTIQMFLQLLDNAYQVFISKRKEKSLIFSLNHRVMQLNNLIDTGIEISKVRDTSALLEFALERSLALTTSAKGLITIYKGDSQFAVIKYPDSLNEKEIFESDSSIIYEFELFEKKYKFFLTDKESREGVISFDTTDELILEAIARQVEAAIESEVLHKEAIENENLKKEISVASSIQQRIIPKSLPDIDGYDIAGINIPSREVGGDYYNVIKLNDGRFALVMADVAGKGIAAALLVSTLDACLGAYLDINISLADMAEKINKLIYNASTQDKFITFTIVVLDPDSGELDIINAGHNPPLLLKDNGELYKIEAGGIAFGMFDIPLEFKGEKINLNSCEKLLLFTDGIPEAMNNKEKEYSDEKLEKFFVSNNLLSSQKFIDSLVNDVRIFTKNTPQSDDITALYLIRK